MPLTVPAGVRDTTGYDEDVDTWPTRWFTAGDLTNKVYYFQSMTSPNVYWVDLSWLDFAPDGKVVALDAYDTSLNGDVTNKFPTVIHTPT